MEVKLGVIALIAILFTGCNSYIGRTGECVKGNVVVKEYKALFVDNSKTLFEDRYITKEYVLTNKENEVIKCNKD